MKGYIYKITNLINGKVYIGQTTQEPQKRWIAHQSSSKRSGNCKKLYRAMNKYGNENFSFEVLEVIEDSRDLQSKLNTSEINWILNFDSVVNGYNISKGGQGCRNSDQLILETDQDGNLIEVWQPRENVSAGNIVSSHKHNRLNVKHFTKYESVNFDWKKQIVEDITYY